MSDEQAFRAAIAASPDDIGLRRVFADWLDENDRPEEAAYQRRWTPEVGNAESWLAAFAVEAGLTYEEVVMAARRYWLTGNDYGTGMNFEPGNVLAFGESNRKPDYDFDGGVYLSKFWECVGLVYGDTVPPDRRSDDVFVCCEFEDADLDPGLFPYPADLPPPKRDDWNE